ncbi:uncharacterized protein [Coffea arabica]|uniref:Integrase zinc-binding domain-containing protein n=1 Tax=Coffea arabica TaxID=13443 RepID=A0ABM4VHJ7_COFAR
MQELVGSYEGDIEAQQKIAQLLLDPNAVTDFQLDKGMLKFKDKLYVGAANNIRSKVIKALHDSAVGEHSGQRGCLRRIQSLFYWPGIKQDVVTFVRSCDVCQRSKHENVPYPGLLQHIPVPQQACVIPAAVNLVQDRLKVISLIKENLTKAQSRMKSFADRHKTERTLQVGDWVFLKLQPYRQQTVAIRKSLKLTTKYYGPFQIIAKVGAVAYKLQLPAGARIHPVFHVSLLKKKIGNAQSTDPVLPAWDSSDQCSLQPEKILRSRATCVTPK